MFTGDIMEISVLDLQGSSPLVRTLHILCGRRVLTAIQYFSKVDSVETASIVQRSLQGSSPLVRTFILHTFLERRRLLTTKCFFNGSTCILSLREISLVINWVCLTCIIPVWRDVLAPIFIRGSMMLILAKQIVATRIIHHVIFEGMRIGEAANPGPRLRRRGPRSSDSRTAQRSSGGQACECLEVNGESSEKGMTMLHLNLRGYLSHIAETTALLRSMEEKLFLVALNETFLTKAIEHVELEGYQVLVRRDREGQWGGGVLVFILDEYAPRVTLVEISEVAERVWVLAHTDRGPYLICCWYRPPNPGNVETIISFEAEHRTHKDGAVGVFVLGDLNVHSIRWLTHSARESAEGRLLCDTSNQMGLRQLVKEPTRGKYILDLVLTDVPDCSAKPCAAVADHNGVLTQVKFKIPETASHEREVWHFSDADWERLESNIEDANLDFLITTFPSEGAQRLTEQLLRITEDNIPRRAVKIRKTTHPWLTERGEQAVRRKHEAQGTEQEADAARECSETLLEEHYEYM